MIFYSPWYRDFDDVLGWDSKFGCTEVYYKYIVGKSDGYTIKMISDMVIYKGSNGWRCFGLSLVDFVSLLDIQIEANEKLKRGGWIVLDEKEWNKYMVLL